MEANSTERRKFKRVVLTLEDGIKVTLYSDKVKNKKFIAELINISIKGLYFTLSLANKLDFEKGDRLILTSISTTDSEDRIVNIDVEIKWVLDSPTFKHAGYGCEFIEVPTASRDQIDQFMDQWEN